MAKVSSKRRKLSQQLAIEGSLDADTASWLFRQLLEQVNQLHTSGQLHRAITGENIFINQQRQLVTLAPLSPTPVVCEEGRLPPELTSVCGLRLPSHLDQTAELLKQQGAPCTPLRIDLFQLGSLAVEVLSGAQVNAYLMSPHVKSKIPYAWQHWIDLALGYSSNARAESCDQLQVALRKMLPAQTVQSDEPTPAAGTGIDVTRDTPALGTPELFQATNVDDLPFSQLGHFRIDAKLGSGGMGDVYRGYDTRLDREVAIKVLPPALAHNEDFVGRFMSEARAAAKLHHPHIVPIYFIGEDQGAHFFAMQYVDGPSLAALLKKRGTLSAKESIKLVSQVAAGLEEAHNHDLIHRDIKPGNILIDAKTKQAKLADFGLVKSLGSGIQTTATGVVMGTVDYIAPEQGRGQSVDGRADLYSLGVLLYHMLSGQLPFVADSPTAMIFQHAYEQPTPLAELVAELPTGLARIVECLMQKNPEDRYQSAAALIEDLQAVREGRAPQLAERQATNDAPATQIILAPEFDTIDQQLQQATEIYIPQIKQGWRTRLQAAFNQHAPQGLKDLQSTQQQVDGGIAIYTQRRNELAALAEEARAVEKELSQDIAKQESAFHAAEQNGDASQATLHRQTIDLLKAQLVEQKTQTEQIDLRLARVDTTLQKLRSQQQLLLARLNTAEAEVTLASPGQRPRSVFRQHFLVAFACITALAVVSMLLLGLKRKTTSIQVPKGIAKPTTEVATGEFALQFDKNSRYILNNTLSYDGSHPLTVEAWCQSAESANGHVVCLFGNSRVAMLQLRLNDHEWSFNARDYKRNLSAMATSDATPAWGQWTHLAGVYDGNNLTLYVNGQKKAQTEAPENFFPSGTQLRIGSDTYVGSSVFQGEIGQVRISRGTRYSGDFNPAEDLASDDDTMVLYRLNEGTGKVALDSSGNGHHGVIRAPQWRELSGSYRSIPDDTIQPQTDTQQLIDGRASISTPKPRVFGPEIRTADDWLALLPTVDLSQDPLPTRWSRNGLELILTNSSSAPERVTIPVAVNGSYQMHFRYLADGGAIGLELPLGVGRGTLVLGTDEMNQLGVGIAGVGGLQAGASDNPTATPNFPLPHNQLHSVSIYVTQKEADVELKVKIDGTEAIYWKGLQRSVQPIDSQAKHPLGFAPAFSGWNNNRLMIDRVSFKLRGGQARFAYVPTSPEKPDAKYGLEFKANYQYGTASSFQYDGTHPLTMEAWVVPEKDHNSSYALAICDRGNVSMLRLQYHDDQYWSFRAYDYHKKKEYSATDPTAILWGKRTHIAGVYHRNQLELFVNGMSVAKSKLLKDIHPQGGGLRIGAEFWRRESSFKGVIEEVRVSRTARYQGPFEPQQLDSDTNTMALYQLNEGLGHLLYDKSGNGHHGIMCRPSWVGQEKLQALAERKADDSLTGTWQINFDSGAQRGVTLQELPDGTVLLRATGVMDGRYRREGDRLIVIEPNDKRYQGLIWQLDGQGNLVLVEEPPNHPSGQSYVGARMKFVSSETSSEARAQVKRVSP